jgi:nucleoside-diphosphate-sugar epimerase
MQPKKILVTGGAGFIGSNLVETLLSDERIGKVRKGTVKFLIGINPN